MKKHKIKEIRDRAEKLLAKKEERKAKYEGQLLKNCPIEVIWNEFSGSNYKLNYHN